MGPIFSQRQQWMENEDHVCTEQKGCLPFPSLLSLLSHPATTIRWSPLEKPRWWCCPIYPIWPCQVWSGCWPWAQLCSLKAPLFLSVFNNKSGDDTRAEPKSYHPAGPLWMPLDTVPRRDNIVNFIYAWNITKRDWLKIKYCKYRKVYSRDSKQIF